MRGTRCKPTEPPESRGGTTTLPGLDDAGEILGASPGGDPNEASGHCHATSI